MDIEKLRSFCLQLPGATEEVKWEKDLCFLIGGKMFCVTGLDQPFSASLKVTDEAFGQLTTLPGISPAPYLARYKWILVENPNSLSTEAWERYLLHSYQLVREKLSAKIKKHLNMQ